MRAFNDPKTALTSVRWTALTEGVSYLILLFIAMPLKYGAGMDVAVSIVGMIHGVLFIALVGALCWAKAKSPLTWPLGWLVLIASLVPFGAFWADRRVRAFMQAELPAEAVPAREPALESV